MSLDGLIQFKIDENRSYAENFINTIDRANI